MARSAKVGLNVDGSVCVVILVVVIRFKIFVGCEVCIHVGVFPLSACGGKLM